MLAGWEGLELSPCGGNVNGGQAGSFQMIQCGVTI